LILSIIVTFEPKERFMNIDDTDTGVNPDPLSGAPGSHPVGVGVGALGGAAAGATVGAVGGPVGAAVGTLVGAVAGALAGKGTAEAMHPTDPGTGAGQGHPVGTGMGAAGGAAAGAAIGSVAGPVGTLVGGVVGAVAGGLAGEGVAEAINPSVEDDYWRRNYTSRPYVSAGARYDRYRRAYEFGWQAYQKNRGRTFEEMEPVLRGQWAQGGPEDLSWEDARDAARDAWQRVERR
jgi:phage tail tape-measure protein